MSVIIAYQNDQGIYAVSDSQTTEGDYILPVESEKWIIGKCRCCGHGSVGVVGAMNWIMEKRSFLLDDEPPIQVLVERLKGIFKEKELLPNSEKRYIPDWGAAFLYAHKGEELYDVDSELVYLRVPSNTFIARWDGRNFALGALWGYQKEFRLLEEMNAPCNGTLRFRIEQALREGVEVATQYSASCGGMPMQYFFERKEVK